MISADETRYRCLRAREEFRDKQMATIEKFFTNPAYQRKLMSANENADIELKRELALMVPELVQVVENFTDGIEEIPAYSFWWRVSGGSQVGDKEWDYIAYEAEKKLKGAQSTMTWQQRTEALKPYSRDAKR